MQLTSRSAIRGVAPHAVMAAVESYLAGAGLARATGGDAEAATVTIAVTIAEQQRGWTTVTWPSYFAPQDLPACAALSRDLHTVVSAVTTTDDEGWSHTLLGCGTVLDRFHSYPAGLAWDDGDVAALAQEWTGDFELVARVCGVDPCSVRRHFCQATTARRDHPGRDRDGYLGLWGALGIRVPDGPAYAVVAADPGWRRVTAHS